MKLCPTCGTPHPDDVTTSHHPDGCTCGYSSLCGGTGPSGCIWMRTVPLAAGQHGSTFDLQLEQVKLIRERAEWIEKFAGSEKKQ